MQESCCSNSRKKPDQTPETSTHGMIQYSYYRPNVRAVCLRGCSQTIFEALKAVYKAEKMGKASL